MLYVNFRLKLLFCHKKALIFPIKFNIQKLLNISRIFKITSIKLKIKLLRYKYYASMHE